MKSSVSATVRTRWAAVGAAVAITLGAGGIGISHATTSSGTRPIYRALKPCRLADTRPQFQVGPRSAALGPNETYPLQGWGAIGNCNLPTGTSALALNVTAVDATRPTFLTLFPGDATLPTASHLNPSPGSAPTPNAVNVALDPSGAFKIYNFAGSVHVVIDVVGVFDDHDHDDRYYTKAQVDADRTRTVTYSPFGMDWPDAGGTSTFNGCPTRPTSSNLPGRLQLDGIPVGASIVGGTIHLYDSGSNATVTATWRGNYLEGDSLLARVLGAAGPLGVNTFGRTSVAVTVDPPFVIGPGSSTWIDFATEASNQNGFCGFDLTYVMPAL